MTTTRGRLCLVAVLAAIITALFGMTVPTPIRAQSSDPCATVSSRSTPDAASEAQTEAAPQESKRRPLDHDDRWRHLDSVWSHRAAGSRRPSAKASGTSSTLGVQAADIGDVTVLQDAGDLMIKPNPLDLRDAGLRLRPDDRGGYEVTPLAYGFRQPLGSSITLSDDATREVALPFAFPYFGQQYRGLFVNSDGNLTFTEGDSSSADRSVARLLSGPPRIALFFSDLDPSAGGRILSSSSNRAFTVTWCGVRSYGSPQTVTAQVTLLPDGTIEMQFSARTTIGDGVVGISPGRTSEFTPVDLNVDPPVSVGQEAVGERFTTRSELDTVAVTRRFLSTHPDDFDSVIIFTDTELLVDAFAYELSISNSIQGLGIPQFDYSSYFGTAGRLQSLCNLDSLGKYPDDPREKFFGENATVSIIGQEFGHRWLAFLEFRDHESRRSRALLGRDGSHWSFFFDSDASVLEGNDIADLGGGSFRTVAAVQRYSLLDQYAMGLIDQIQVPPFFYVQNPTNVVPRRTATSAPAVGTTFNGTRRDVRIEDVIAVLGPRVPSAADSPRVYKQAFLYIASAGRTAEPGEIQKVDRIRMAWDQFLSAATDSRMRVDTRLSLSTTSREDPALAVE
jgi:hypothetical protein